MENLKGQVTRITFSNEENGFTILRLRPDGEDIDIACLGLMPTIAKGEMIDATGSWQVDKKFGKQFKIESYKYIRPTTKDGVLHLLSSGAISGIGPSRANDIIAMFGDKTVEILDKTPEELLKIRGIGKNGLEKIKRSWQKQGDIKELMLFLHQFELTTNFINTIYKTYRERAMSVISKNPYRLIDDIRGVGFMKADDIAIKLGFKHDSYRRIKAGIIFTLKKSVNSGHTFLLFEQLIANSVEILKVDQSHIIASIDYMKNEKALIAVDDSIYLPELFTAERFVADDLIKRVASNRPELSLTKLNSWLSDYEKKTGWQGDELQIKAVREAAINSILLLTGGPGTGKTTTLQVIVSFFKDEKSKIALTAPTGRAAQKMGDVAGEKASTIHRLLEYNPHKKGNPFLRNTENQLDIDILICDETSMIDTIIMQRLLEALPQKASVIFVGDSDQLPSVGAGNVLLDMINSRKIPHCDLKKVFRQAAKSRIVTVAHEIKNDIVPKFENDESDNCFFLKKDEPEICLNAILDLVENRIPKKWGINPIRDIQILAPMHNGVLGTKNLNIKLQALLNKNSNSKPVIRGDSTFFLGDKVMQIKNNYDNGVFNGDIGYVVSVDENHGLAVNVNGRDIYYKYKELDELTLAYCISIHKSQGSEFNTVIVPLVTSHFVMLQKNLVYTAITRAKTLCIIAGSEKAFSMAIRNREIESRNSNLARFIIEG